MFEYIISFIAPLAYFLFLTATLVQITKRSFGKCLPIGMMLSAFLLFFSQLVFNTFWVGFVIGILFAAAAIPLLMIKRKKWSEFRKSYFTIGFVVFLIIYIGIYVYDLCTGFHAWDEFMHWGMMVKEMTRLDHFYSVDASNLMVHKDYPPIIQLFELFWTKLCGGFSEACVNRALHTFELSLIIPFVAEKILSKKDCLKNVLAGVFGVFSFVLVILLFDITGIINTVYLDYAMALLVVYMLMVIFVSKKITWFEIFTIALSGSFLLLLKQMGLPLYFMVLCFLIGILWLRKGDTVKNWLKSIGYKKIIISVVALIIPLLLWFIWGKLVNGTAQQFELSNISVKEFAKVLIGHGAPWQTETVNNFTTALAQVDISSSYIEISYLQSIVLFIGLMWLVYKIFKGKIEKKEMSLLTVIVVVGSIGYAVAMLMLYTLSFTEIEAPKLASYHRYMDTFAMIMMCLVVFIIVWHSITSGKRGVVYATMIILCLLVSPEAYGLISPNIHRADAPSSAEIDAKKISEIVPEDGKVYLLAQESEIGGGYNFFVQYYGTPIKFSWKSWDPGWDASDDVDAEKYYREVALPEVEKYDYMLVVEATEKFSKKYCEELKICPIKEGDLYKVVLNDDGSFNKYEFVKNIRGEG